MVDTFNGRKPSGLNFDCGMSLLLERLTPGPTPTDNEVMLYSIMWYQKGGRNRERKCRITAYKLSPPVFCTKAKIAKGGGVFAGHYGI